MPLYDFECNEGHLYEVRCAIADRDKPHPCTAGAFDESLDPPVRTPCGAPGRQVILTAPHVNDPSKCVIDYPGSKRLKAGYVHTHGDRPAGKTSSGYGGMVQANNTKHHHPIAANVQPEAVAPKKPVTW